MSQTAGQRLSLRHVLAIRAAEFFSMPEGRYEDFIQEIENDPLFLKLSSPSGGEAPAVKRRRPAWGLSPAFWVELNEKYQAAPPDYAGLQELLANQPAVLELIRRLGREKFERFFLYNEDPLKPEEMADACGLGAADCRAVQNFVTQFLARCPEASAATPWREPGGAALKIVATIEQEAEGITMGYTSIHYARGRYEINPKALEQFLKREHLRLPERRRLNEILSALRAINIKQTALERLLQLLKDLQNPYWTSADPAQRRVLTQKELAQRLQISAGQVSRLLKSRGILTPWGALPLSYLAVSPAERRRALIEKIEEQTPGLSAREIQTILRQRHHDSASIRLINQNRRHE